MFGNLSTNRQIKRLRDDRCIYIDPFEESSLKATGYTLNPKRVLRRSDDGDWEVAQSLTERSVFELAPDEYVIVEPRQAVRIAVDGIVGRFVPASTNIESGLLVVAGQIDSKYGMSGETLRFGVKNLLSKPNYLKTSTRLVHLEIFDIRGTTADPVQVSGAQKGVWESRINDPKWRRADSDGPIYGD
jgi:deoxycytidine triphosphate deaminase